MRELQQNELNQVNGGFGIDGFGISIGFVFAAVRGSHHAGYVSTILLSTLVDTCISTYSAASVQGVGGFALLTIPPNIISAFSLDTLAYFACSFLFK
ncbi:MAG: hypothetical protein ACHQJ6_08735 [Candidatus Berkiellales bacterium]